MIKAELLAPAGDMECLESALRFGADAVYIGGSMLQLRAVSAGFPDEELSRAAEKVHAAGKKLYVTVNSVAENGEIDRCADYGKFLHDSGVDAVIVSDLGVLRALSKAVPELEIHISTQASCSNYMSAITYHELGAKRIVLAREMRLEEIGELRSRTPATLELEAFVHGAMCMAVSGRCLISSFLTGRSGNRGQCAQPCRWKYALVEEKRPGEYMSINEDSEFSAILSSHDLCCIDLLDDLNSAGVSSFKIEGRMKSAYYVATAVNAYRMAMDGGDISYCRRELDCLTHRPYTTGFYLGSLPREHANSGTYSQSCTFVGQVLDFSEGVAHVQQRNCFSAGEVLEVLSPGKEAVSFTVCGMKNSDGEAVDRAPHPKQDIYLPCPVSLKSGDILRRRECNDENA